MLRKPQLRTAVPYVLSALALLALSACQIKGPSVVTVTPLPAATVTQSGALGSNIQIQTLPPHPTGVPPTATAAPPTDTPLPTDYVPPTPGPAATISGTAIAQGVQNAQAFNAAAPTQIGPFHLVNSGSSAYQYGSVLYYQTEDGAVYTIVMYLTNGVTDALSRYTAELQNAANPQPLKLGDDAVYSMVDTHVLALIHYRNVVIDIYRPDPSGTVPTVKLTEDQVKQLATQIFQIVPKK